jgi:transposase-like protein
MRCGRIAASRLACVWSDMLATCGIIVSYESVRRWALKVDQDSASRDRRMLPCAG